MPNPNIQLISSTYVGQVLKLILLLRQETISMKYNSILSAQIYLIQNDQP